MATLKDIEAMKTYVDKCTAAMTWLESRGIEYEEENEKMFHNFMRYIERLEEQVKPITWTSKKPNRAGFYWFQADDCGAEVCLVSTLGDGVSAYFVNGRRHELYELPRGQWSSEPITEPQEAK